MNLILLLVISLWFCPAGMASDLPKDTRMEWWREARFGMFIHWGLYSIPAGAWEDKTTHGEWIRQTAQIPIEEYDQFIGEFNPLKFDADEWARMAKAAGMNYRTIIRDQTSKNRLYHLRFYFLISDFIIKHNIVLWFASILVICRLLKLNGLLSKSCRIGWFIDRLMNPGKSRYARFFVYRHLGL